MPFIVSAVAAVIDPDAFIVVTPDTAPAPEIPAAPGKTLRGEVVDAGPLELDPLPEICGRQCASCPHRVSGGSGTGVGTDPAPQCEDRGRIPPSRDRSRSGQASYPSRRGHGDRHDAGVGIGGLLPVLQGP